MYNFDNDILEINIYKNLYIENILILKETSKKFCKINIEKIIIKRYKINYDIFKELFIEFYHYNKILEHIIHINYNTLYFLMNNFISHKYPFLYSHFNILLYNITKNKHKYFDQKIKYIYNIISIKPIIKYLVENTNIFCLLFANLKKKNNNEIKYEFDVDIITKKYNKMKILYNIFNYSVILYNSYLKKKSKSN